MNRRLICFLPETKPGLHFEPGSGVGKDFFINFPLLINKYLEMLDMRGYFLDFELKLAALADKLKVLLINVCAAR